MTFTLYQATVPQFVQILGATAKLIDKAEQHCADSGLAPAELIEARLAPDMHPFSYQVKSTVVHSLGAIEGVRAGTFSPDRTTPPDSFHALRARVSNALDALQAVTPADIDGLTGREMAFVMGDMRLPFTAETFLMSFSMPNFMFHASTAYDILRHRGLAIGKLDFMGRLQIKR